MIGIGIGIAAGPWPAAGAGGGAAAARTPLLLIVGGQSNAGKQGTQGLTPPAKYDSLDLQLWRINGGQRFEPYVCGGNLDDYGDAWGTEAEFVYQLQATLGSTRPVYMVKRSVGGTAMAQSGANDWNAASSGELFDQLRDRVAAARAAVVAAEGVAPEEITFWSQGENDIWTTAYANAYAANLDAFMTRYRSEISTGLFIFERTRPMTSDYDNSWVVREAQIAKALSDGNAAIVDTDFTAGGEDFTVIHAGRAWAEGVGLRAWAAYRGTYAAAHGAITDTAPDAFAVPDLTGQATGAPIQSAAITPTGYQRRAAISVAGGQYRVLNPDDSVSADWTTSDGHVSPHQKVQLLQTSSGDTSTTTTMTLTIGGVSATWSVTTGATATYTQHPIDSNGSARFSINPATSPGTNTKVEFSVWFSAQTLGNNRRFVYRAGGIDIGISGAGAYVIGVYDDGGSLLYSDSTADGVLGTGALHHLYFSYDYATGAAVAEVDGVSLGLASSGSAGTPRDTGAHNVFHASTTNLFDLRFADLWLAYSDAFVGPAAFWNGGTPPDLTGAGSPCLWVGGAMTATTLNNAGNLGSEAVVGLSGSFTDATFP